MKIQVAGINHKDAPVTIRERVAIGPDRLAEGYRTRDTIRHQDGLVVVSTCNRTEIYVSGNVVLGDILAWWENLVQVPRADFSSVLFWAENDEAATHLMRVASGVDSMVLGETQILGQVKEAYELSQSFGAAGSLHRLFQYALRAGKRAHSETGISQNALSMGYAVVELAKKVFGTLHDRRVLIVGAGDTAQLVARHLASQPIGSLVVANRTRKRAEELAHELRGRVSSLSQLDTEMRQADIVVSATSAPFPLITRDMAASALRGQSDKFRFFFDLAVPRDIDPAVQELGRGVFLYDIDDVRHVVSANREKREREVFKVERLIGEEVIRFQEEMGASQVGPVIRSLRDKAEAIRQAELARAMHRLPNLTDEEREVVAETTRLIMNKFLNDAMVSMRSWGKDEQKRSYVDAVQELFHLTDEGAGASGS